MNILTKSKRSIRMQFLIKQDYGIQFKFYFQIINQDVKDSLYTTTFKHTKNKIRDCNYP